jgi:hypothetical protein
VLANIRDWLVIVTIVYLTGALGSCSTVVLIDTLTKPRILLAQVRPGMTAADVEAIIGRPSEYKVNYACMPDCGPFSHNWTVYGHRVEVHFDLSGRVDQVHAYHREPDLFARISHWVFFWWFPDLD